MIQRVSGGITSTSKMFPMHAVQFSGRPRQAVNLWDPGVLQTGPGVSCKTSTVGLCQFMEIHQAHVGNISR